MVSGLVWELWPLGVGQQGWDPSDFSQGAAWEGWLGPSPDSTCALRLGWQGHLLVLEMYLVGNPLSFSSGTSFLLPDSPGSECVLLGEAAPQPCFGVLHTGLSSCCYFV